jgi:hypothetical protein
VTPYVRRTLSAAFGFSTESHRVDGGEGQALTETDTSKLPGDRAECARGRDGLRRNAWPAPAAARLHGENGLPWAAALDLSGRGGTLALGVVEFDPFLGQHSKQGRTTLSEIQPNGTRCGMWFRAHKISQRSKEGYT